MRLLARVLVPIAAAALATAPAQAALDGSCAIMVTRQGVITNNPGITVLSSQQTGGRSAQASISITPGILGGTCTLLNILTCFSLSVVPALGFSSAPTGGGTGVVLTSVMRIDGSPIQHLEIVPVAVTNGNHTVDVELTATRALGIFPAGNYQGIVTLRCE